MTSSENENLELDTDTEAENEAENDAEAGEKSKDPSEFAKMLEASTRKPQKRLSVGDKIDSEILVIGREDIFVSTGTQNDGVVSRRELQNEAGQVPHKVGDKIKLYVTQVRGTEVRLSPNATSKNLADDLEDAFDMMLPLEGRVVEVCKGGVRVSIGGKIAFCPISQLDLNRTETGEEFIGKKLEFLITKFEEGGRNIVVSRRKLLEDERELAAGSYLAEHKAGDIVSGKVARLEKFGAFIELAPGIDGLAHVSELAWSRVGDPSEVLSVGQAVEVKILKIETAEGKQARISLSIKQTGDRPAAGAAQDGRSGSHPDAAAPSDPWTALTSKFPVGTVVKGVVERKELYGLFVKLAPGVTGLLHKSRMADQPDFQWEKSRPGLEITVQVAELRPAERRISLDFPKDTDEDWKNYAAPETSPAGSFGSLGGALADQLKKAMENKANAKKKP